MQCDLYLVNMKKIIISIVLIIALPFLSLSKSISPFDMGLREAITPEDRYMVLYYTHKYAIDHDMTVNYSGIVSIDIAIPEGALSIPLGRLNNFAGITINVLNTCSTHTLFVLQNELIPLTIDARICDEQNYKSVECLKKKKNLLIIHDDNPWGDTRNGFSYSAQRADIIYIEKGSGMNLPVKSYNNTYSSPSYYYCPTDSKIKEIKNITINRDVNSTCSVYCFSVQNQNNVSFSNITINTPESSLYGDAAISIINCTNVRCSDIYINGTYSQVAKYGYGIYMNNVWNSKFSRVFARANWGVFGTNNISDIALESCDINRFDIHSYGRNVVARNCFFRDLYNQYSSVYGVVQYDNCHFVNFIPVLTEPSYNSYVPYELIMNNCVMEISNNRNYIVEAGRLHDYPNKRNELQIKSLPNISIHGLRVVIPENLKQFNIFKYTNPTNVIPQVDNLSRIEIDGLQFEYSDTKGDTSLYLIDAPITTEHEIEISMNNMDILPYKDEEFIQVETKYYYPNSFYININNSCPHRNHIIVSNSRLNYNTISNNVYSMVFNKCSLGLVRYNSLVLGRRTYKECNIYLNCSDDNMYYIDKNADYISCKFKLCSTDRKISFVGLNNNVRFYRCSSDSYDIFSEDVLSKEVLNNSHYINDKFQTVTTE